MHYIKPGCYILRFLVTGNMLNNDQLWSNKKQQLQALLKLPQALGWPFRESNPVGNSTPPETNKKAPENRPS